MRSSSFRRHTVLASLTVVLAIAVLGTDVWLLAQRNRTTTVDLTEALDRYRAAVTPETETTPPSTTPAGGGVIVAASPATTEIARAVEAPQASDPAPRPSTPAGAPTVAAVDHRPAEGVYTYRTSGGEEISTAGAEHSYPERTYASVRRGDGCVWEIESDVIEEHRDHREMCSDGTSSQQLSQTREVEFFGQRDGFTMVCRPPAVLEQAGEPVGAVTEATCTDEGITSHLVRTFVGMETMTIGGRDVAVRHIRIRGDFSGRATGYAEEEHWTIPGSGLTARWKRMVDTTADAAFGARVRYQENADFVLESLEPQV